MVSKVLGAHHHLQTPKRIDELVLPYQKRPQLEGLSLVKELQQAVELLEEKILQDPRALK